MGIRIRSRVLTEQLGEPIVDVGTDEGQVVKRLRRFAATGDFGYDDSRDWAELFPTIRTLIGALHLLPSVLEGLDPEQRERLAELLDAKFEEQFSWHDRNLFARAIEPNPGMSTAYRLQVEVRRLGERSAALAGRNRELVEERGIAYRATVEWKERFEEAGRLDAEKRELLLKLHHDPDFGPTARKTTGAWRAISRVSGELREALLGYIEGDGEASYDRLQSSAGAWLLGFEALKRRVREPNPRRTADQPAGDLGEDAYDEEP